jgi:hypothetical protein
MWTLYQTASASHSRPSDLLCVEDRLAAYLFDAAVTTFGRVIENAAQEEVNNGSPTQPKWERKYTLMQLLSQDFKLPYERPKKKPTEFGNFAAHGIAQILAAAEQGTRGIRRWEYKPDEP